MRDIKFFFFNFFTHHRNNFLEMNKIPVIVDETGQPYIILRDQQETQRAKGIDALKNNIFAAVALGNTIKTSYGPRGMDKALISKDGEVTVSNDGFV
jgi:T-complex protein 1 subunit epsilon